MTTWQSLNKENQEMVDKFTSLAIIQTKEVENAFRCVNRAAFVSSSLYSEAFMDVPIKEEPHLHLSAPHIYATILEDLELEPGKFINTLDHIKFKDFKAFSICHKPLNVFENSR